MGKIKENIVITFVVVMAAAEISMTNEYIDDVTFANQQGVCLIQGISKKKGNQRINTLINYLFHHRKN